ncbi:zinc-binding alcohol dehydrogenase family protein [Pectobacterium aroidearum]|uniref:zinc-binding alcohol dehydrogenase family protein n=1 Tax=Pectobacterium aroidearum TaxID=1201031 RepID=UPI0032ECC494
MKAVGYFKNLPATAPDALQDIILDEPFAQQRDLLVEVKAISVNPVDTKVRRGSKPADGAAKVLGWDVAGIVRSVGKDVTLFKPGDRVFYAGDITRQGANAELHAVDERIVGRMPESLSFAQAAALPLTSITAWELLFDRLEVSRPGTSSKKQHLLVVGAAGGVGSILVQLARQLTDLVVIGTASRPETKAWVTELGAHHVLDHSKPLASELRAAGLPEVDFVASLTETGHHLPQLIEALKPQGRIGVIDDPASLDVMPLKRKSISLHWELMYTRSIYQTEDMIEQHRHLNRVSKMVDDGQLKSTVAEHFGTINAANLRRAHELLESGKARGKIVLEGF